MDPNQCEHENTWKCLLYRAHARSMKKHGETLSDQAKQCLACHKNKGSERVGISKTAVMACEICRKPKTCKKCYGMFLCSSCICVVGMIKKKPEQIPPIWERFGPADTPLSKSTAADAAAIAAPEISLRAKSEERRAKEMLAANHSSFSDLLFRMAAIHDAKKHDYASNEDCLGNFREARRLGITPLQGIMVRLTDKYTRACNWVRRNGDHAVKDEGLEDTLLDLANYSCLAILAHKEEQVEGGRLKAEGEEDHNNAKDMHQDHWTANSTGDLSELPKEVPARGEEEEEQVEVSQPMVMGELKNF